MISKMSSIALILIYFAITYQGNIFTGACVDQNEHCSYWVGIGECTRNPLYMLDKCPISCNVCFGGVVCTNVYSDQHCAQQVGNCWLQGNNMDLVKNCRKTCVCSCCSALPATTIATTKPATTTAAATTPTTVRTTNVSTARTTTEGTGEGKTTAHALTEFRTQTPSKSKDASSSLTTGDYTQFSEQDPAGRAVEKKGFNPALLGAIIAGVVVVIGVVGLSVFCIWRKRRARSSNAEGKSRPSEESPEIPVADSAETPLYYVLEGPNVPSPSNNQASSAEYEQPSEGLLSDSKTRDNVSQLYEDVDGQSTRNVLYQPSNDDAPDNSNDYCYSYSVANEDLTLRVNKNRPHEDPNSQKNGYQALEGSNAGYQAPENSADKEKLGGGGYEVMRDIDPSGYLPLKKPTQTQTFYQPLKKTSEPPQRAYTGV